MTRGITHDLANDMAHDKQHDYSSIGFITFDCLGWPFVQMPEGGGTHLVEDFTLAVSGAAGTAAIAAAKMGLKVQAIGGVGDDLMGEWVRRRLHDFHVDTELLQTIAGGRTSSSIVTTRADGSRPVLHLKGATGDFYLDDDQFDRVTDAHVVHFGGVGLMNRMDQGQNARLARHARARGAITTLDVFATSPAEMAAVEAMLPHTDYFMPSIEEAHALTGRSDLHGTAEFFLERGVRCCIFTMGADGAYYADQEGHRMRVPAFQVDVRCTCGCGDAFNAGFAVALRHGLDPETCVRLAQATSALNATGLGSQAGVVDLERTLDFMRRTPTRALASIHD
jgi:sugar/nucleoside kinase (ribokinase family)